MQSMHIMTWPVFCRFRGGERSILPRRRREEAEGNREEVAE